MDQNLKTILDFIQHNENLSAEEKALLVGLVSNVDKELSITTFKLDRTEKVKRTTAILLEETIEELEQKRKAVEMQNRELEIEAALERVRSVAMGMTNQEDLLDICTQLYKELQSLGFGELRNTMIHTFFDEKKYFINYDFSDATGACINRIPYHGNPLMEKFINDIRTENDAFSELVITGKELDDWKAFRKANKEYDDPRLNGIASLHYYNYSVVDSGIGISTYSAISAEKLNILRRFRNVFDLAYKRYADITKAEAQARDAQIEAGLERVRSRSLAMHKTGELQSVIHTVHHELLSLNLSISGGSFIVINSEIDTELHCWGSGGTADTSDEIHIPYYDKPFYTHILKRIKSGPGFFTEEYTQEEKIEFFNFLFQHKPWSKLGTKEKTQTLETPGGYTRSCAVFKHTSIFIINHFGEKYSETENAILKRFGKVFEQAYTRFLDLQKAEAQAREAKIEAAMEKIRSYSMAMQNPEELIEVAEILRREMGQLGVEELETSSIYLVSEDNQTAKCWYAIKDVREGNSKLVSDEFTIVFRETWVASMMWDFYNSAEEQGSIVMTGNNRKEWINYCADRSQILQGYYGTEIPARSYHLVKFNGGYLGAAAPGDISAESWKLIKRATKVFSLAYTRFSDLKQAKVQAREAQIEAALERVRSRTMGMQKSVELKEVIKIVYQQLTHLKIKLDHAGFVVDYEPKGDWHFWIADERDIPSQITHPWFESVWAKQFNEAKEKGGELFATLLNFEEKNKFYNKLLSYLPGLPKASRDFYLSCPGLAATTVLSDNVSLYIENFSGTPYNVEENNILIRFARVFEQTYTRFLDLQKAEAQAREAQIELSLERIRAQVTAMRESSELLDIVVTMRSEFVALGHEAHYFWHMRWLPEEYEKAMTSGDGTRIGMVMTLPRHIHGDIKLVADWEKSEEPSVVLAMDVETAINYVDKMITLGDFQQVDPQAPTLDDIRHIGGLTFVMARTTHGEIGFSLPGTVHHPPAESIATLTRFASVFDLAYKRFKDLKSTERQHREAQIELALERTRNQSMRMQNSGELNDISKTFHEQLLSLGIDSEFSFVWLPDEVKQEHIFWATWVSDINDVAQYESKSVKYPLDKKEPGTAKCYMDWESGQPIHETYISPDQIDSFFAAWEALLEGAEQFKPELFPEGIYYTEAYMKYGCFGIDIRRQLTSEEKEIIRRFSVEFERTYTRFLDLQKAEAQAREAQIEAALERVRAQAMAMHQTEDLGKTIMIYYEQLDNLIDTTIVRCGAGLLNKENTIAEMSTASKSPDGEIYYVRGKIEMQGHSLLDNTYEHWLKQEEYSHVLHGNDISKYYKYITNQVAIPGNTGDDDLYFYFPMFNEGSFYVVTNNEVPEDELQIFRRFGTVLSLTYRRFNDLQRAEAQAREAQIEASLEKVRSRSLAMHKSEELNEVVSVLFEKLKDLHIPFTSIGIGVYIKGSKDLDTYVCGENEAGLVITNYRLPYFNNPIPKDLTNALEKQLDFFVGKYSKEEKDAFYNYVLKHTPEFRHLPEDIKGMIFDSPTYTISMVSVKNAVFNINDFEGKSLTENEIDIIKRFARVFDQAYTRFLDLQKAESQAREAQIEAALERVRSQSMGMQSSKDFSNVTTEMFNQLRQFGGDLFATGIVFCDKHKGHVEQWHSLPNAGMLSPFIVPVNLDYIHQYRYDQWKKGVELFEIEIPGDFIEQHFNDIFNLPSAQKVLKDFENQHTPMPETPLWEIDYGASFKHGYILVSSLQPFKEAEILPRFAKVFEQTYTRFLDLQKAEAQAREATKRASVDRVRAEIASMRTTKDLERITPLIWNELTTLGVPFIRSGVFIMDEAYQQIQVHLSSPDGKAIAAFQLNYETSVQSRQIVSHWREMKVFKDHMDEGAFAEYTKNLVQQGALAGDEKYVTENHPTDLYLHFLPFAQGMLYVGNDAPLKEEGLQLVQDLADAFSTAYARYEDFNKLEAAKLQVDKALVNLKQAQQQLVQSEKMASLGELTAGIAHEIQNPLNFVNNFSEVSSELVDEMNEELGKGNIDDAKEIATDLKQNLEKITHHGKRAGEIVKGMLQHSRTSSGQKEATDLNVLADEYLRLAYHGLRAKDKTFNSKMKTDFDPALPKIEVVPQDIGRVILNLITNAFYAVNEKAKQGIAAYEPTVSVSTKKKENAIEISVKDNGNGIPEQIKEKIFQPFFTTKPTGQGTGLGLSLSYDIVKAHGGELTLETKFMEGLPSEVPFRKSEQSEAIVHTGSNFIITLTV